MTLRIFVVGELGQEPRDVADLAEAQALADQGEEVYVPDGDRDGDGIDDVYKKLEPSGRGA